MRRSARHAVIALAALCAFGLAHAGCGAGEHPPLFGADGAEPTRSASANDAGGGALQFDAAPPACPVGPDGGVCGCLDLPLLGDPPNLYFVLDRSGSMEQSDKWQTVRAVVTDVMRRLGPRARFGAAVFPDPRVNACAAGLEVMAPRLGDSPAGTYGPTSSAFGAATNMVASGGTPTAATIAAIAKRVTGLAGKTYVILATDGGPNCDPNAPCGVAQCIPNIESEPGCTPNVAPSCCDNAPENCLDAAASIGAVRALAAAGVPTYVIGVLGSGPYAQVLDGMAQAGGTQRYYDVTSTDQSALAAALGTIAAKITATCTFDLGEAPPDPTSVNVYLDGVIVPQDPVDGWRVDGSKVTLLGATCDEVLTGRALAVRIVAGCPTVVK